MNLSLDKTLAMLKDNDTTVLGIYAMRIAGETTAQCLFFEAASATCVRPFMIHVPNRFKVSLPKDVHDVHDVHDLNITYLLPASEQSVQLQLEHLELTLGTLTTSALSLSSAALCYKARDDITNVPSARCFRIVSSLEGPYDEKKYNDPLSELVGQVEEVAPSAISTELVDQAQPFSIDADADVQVDVDVPTIPKFDENDSAPEGVLQSTVPPSLLCDEIELGLLYLTVDLSTFYRNRTRVESELDSNYALLDDNELDVRQEKISQLQALITEVQKQMLTLDERVLASDDITTKKFSTLQKLLAKVVLMEQKDGNKQKIGQLKSQIQFSIGEETIVQLRRKDFVLNVLNLCSIILTEALSAVRGLQEELQGDKNSKIQP